MPHSDDQESAPIRVVFQRNFGPYFVGSFLSNAGTWFQNVAQALLVYHLSGSVLLVGVVNFAQSAGVLVLAPWAGAAADRFDRKKLLLITQVAAALITGVLTLLAALNAITVPAIMVLALLLSLTTAFAFPTQKAFLTTLVSRANVGAALTMDSVSFNLARVVGPILAALVMAQAGAAWAFGLNALSFAIFGATLLVIHPTPWVRASGRMRLRDSVSLLWQKPRVALLLGVMAAFAITYDPVSTLTPAYAASVFHQPDTLVGELIGAFGGGAVLAALLITRQPRTPDRRLSIMLGVMSVGIVALGLAVSPAMAIVVLILAGFGYLGGQTLATTLLQLGVDDSQRGRVMALWTIAFVGTRPVASLIDGAVAQRVGVRPTTMLMALPTVALMLVLIAVQVRAALRQRAVDAVLPG